MCGCRNFTSERGRHLSKATQQVSERGESRILCVLGLDLKLRRARGCGSIVYCSEQLSGFPVSGRGLDVVPGLLELAGGRRLDKNGNSSAKHYDLIRYPWGTASCYFRLNWAFCF